MPIPPMGEWVRVEVADVEAEFRARKSDAAWMEKWHALVGKMEPGDELWAYNTPKELWQMLGGRAGYAVKRSGEIIDDLVVIMN